MKRLKFFLLAAIALLAVGCESSTEFDVDSLAQTIWKGHFSRYNEMGNTVVEQYRFTVQFTTADTGKYISEDSEVSYFEYDIEDKLLTIELSSGKLDVDFNGSWIMHDSTKDKIELVCYSPTKEFITLTREY